VVGFIPTQAAAQADVQAQRRKAGTQETEKTTENNNPQRAFPRKNRTRQTQEGRALVTRC
jgi:hypothetical protein